MLLAELIVLRPALGVTSLCCVLQRYVFAISHPYERTV